MSDYPKQMRTRDGEEAEPADPVEALRLSSALLALLPECKGATHSVHVAHCAECCFGSGYELHGPEDQVILDAATFLARLEQVGEYERRAVYDDSPTFRLIDPEVTP